MIGPIYGPVGQESKQVLPFAGGIVFLELHVLPFQILWAAWHRHPGCQGTELSHKKVQINLVCLTDPHFRDLRWQNKLCLARLLLTKLFMQKKPLSFLHVFHHATVIPMAYFWLADAQSLQQIALLTNTFIHVLMYFYYFLCSLGRGPNWKRLITNAQIVQFVFRYATSVKSWLMCVYSIEHA